VICSGQEIPVVFVTASGSDVRSALPHPTAVRKPFGSTSPRTSGHRNVLPSALAEIEIGNWSNLPDTRGALEMLLQRNLKGS